MSENVESLLRLIKHNKAYINLEGVDREAYEIAESIINELRDLLSEAIYMTGEPDCYHDHHGYCQAHNLQDKDQCWVKRAKDLIGDSVR